MPALPIADKATLDQVLAYVDTLETLIGTANPVSGGSDTLFHYLYAAQSYLNGSVGIPGLGQQGDAANAAGSANAKLAYIINNYKKPEQAYIGSYTTSSTTLQTALSVSGSGTLIGIAISCPSGTPRLKITLDGTVVLDGIGAVSVPGNQGPSFSSGFNITDGTSYAYSQSVSSSQQIIVPNLMMPFKTSLLLEGLTTASTVTFKWIYSKE